MKILILSYRDGCHAWLEFVRLGAGRDHDHHDSRDYHGSAADGDAADNDYSEHRLLSRDLLFTGSARPEWVCALLLACRSLDFGFRFFFRLTDNGRDGLQFFAFAQSEELHSHGIAAGLTYFLYPRPNQLTFGCDQHQFIDVGDRERADDIAGLVPRLHRDDAFAAAGLFPVIIKRRPFSDSILARNQQHRRRIHDRAGNNVIIFLRPNSPNTDSIASLIAQLFFVKPQAHSFLGNEDELVVSRSKFRVNQAIIGLNLNGDDSAFSDVSVIGKVRFFYDAGASRENYMEVFVPGVVGGIWASASAL